MDGVLHHDLGGLGALDERLLHGALGEHGLAGDCAVLHLLLDSLVGYVVSHVLVGGVHCVGHLLHLAHGVVLGHGFVGHVGLVLGLVLDLLIVGVGHLHGVVVGVLDCLVVSDCLGHGHGVTDRGVVLVLVLTLIRDLFVSDHGLVVCVRFLDRDVFDPGLWLWSSQGLGDWLANN